MRCIVVNGATLKAEACCTYCRKKIGDSYLREIGSRFLYCDYTCYQCGSARSALPTGYAALPLSAWTLGS
jgi:hypothetical protein